MEVFNATSRSQLAPTLYEYTMVRGEVEFTSQLPTTFADVGSELVSAVWTPSIFRSTKVRHAGWTSVISWMVSSPVSPLGTRLNVVDTEMVSPTAGVTLLIVRVNVLPPSHQLTEPGA